MVKTDRRCRYNVLLLLYVETDYIHVITKNPLSVFFSSEPEDAIKALGDFQQVSRPVAITFKEMTTLMRQCQQVEDGKTMTNELSKNITTHPIGRGILANNPFVLLSGIIPGVTVAFCKIRLN